MSIYSHLFTYSPRNNKSQLENFLTEALCDLFNRLIASDRESHLRLLRNSLLLGTEPLVAERIAQGSRLIWTTQRTLVFEGRNKRPDLWLMSDGVVLLVVEVKVSAGFTLHKSDQSETEDLTQLRVYDHWLAENHPKAALIFLTHHTEPPPGFEARVEDAVAESIHAQSYKLASRVMCRWSLLAKTLEESSSARDSVTNTLVREFAVFLKGCNMSVTPIREEDVRTLSTFVQQDVLKKMKGLAESSRDDIKALIPNYRNAARRVPETNAWGESQIFWDWAYCFPPELKWFLGWGVSGPHGLRHLGFEFPSPLQAFFVAASEGTEIRVQETDVAGLNWELSNSRRMKTALCKNIAVTELVKGGGDFNEAFQLWLRSSVREAVQLLSIAAKKT